MIDWEKHRMADGKLDLIMGASDVGVSHVVCGKMQDVVDMLEDIQIAYPIASRQAATIAVVMARHISFEMQLRRAMT